MKTAPRGSMHLFDRTKGLNILQRDFQKKFMGEQCADLVAFMDRAIATTAKNYKTRDRLFLVSHASGDPESRSRAEDKVEWQFFGRYRALLNSSSTPYWQRIVDYQVSLKHDQKSEWGKIDLLGLDASGLPIVIEVKAGTSRVTPAAFVVQAVAYAVALKKAWSGRFGKEWSQVENGGTDRKGRKLATLSTCPAVCLAPAEYWDGWTAAYKERWAEPLSDLISEFGKRGLPITLVSLKEIGDRFVLSTVDVRSWLTSM